MIVLKQLLRHLDLGFSVPLPYWVSSVQIYSFETNRPWVIVSLQSEECPLRYAARFVWSAAHLFSDSVGAQLTMTRAGGDMKPTSQDDGFTAVLNEVKPLLPREGSQNTTRHYSESLSKGLAHWLRELLVQTGRFKNVLTPEGKVPTCFGAKSLDVACLDENRYLALDISIKTFSFRDGKSQQYDKNFTGRFYELLGEGLDLRLTYPQAVLTALVFVPLDGCDDDAGKRRASSFGKAVKQYSKITGKGTEFEHSLCFEHVYIALYDEAGVMFFDAAQPPPKVGKPPREQLLTTWEMLDALLATVDAHAVLRASSKADARKRFRWATD